MTKICGSGTVHRVGAENSEFSKQRGGDDLSESPSPFLTTGEAESLASPVSLPAPYPAHSNFMYVSMQLPSHRKVY